MTTLFNWSSSSEPWWPKQRQNIIIALTTLPQGWVSTCKHQCTTAITTMWTESSWAFPESYTADDSWIVCSSNGDQWKTKAHRTPQPRWVSAQLLYVLVNARRRSRWSSQNLRRPFLRAGRFDYLFNYLFTSGNRTPGSRLYSNLLDTSVCIVLKRRSKFVGG